MTGRMKSDYMYSVGVVYNTFPTPTGFTSENADHSTLELLAQAVLDFDRYLYIKVGFELFFKFFDYTLENLVAHWTRRVRPFAHRFKLFNKTLKNLAKNPRLEVPDLKNPRLEVPDLV